MPVDHYENFPVASLLLPARLRPAVQTLYAFARTADDLADEGALTDDERLQGLQAYRSQLDRIRQGLPAETALFSRLQEVIARHRLPLQPFYDLLSAFSQDVVTRRYADFPALQDYCRRSANPVGRLLLHLYEAPSPENLAASDAICSALQLINFCQDVAIDWEKGRVYLPQDELRRFGVSESQLATGRVDAAWQELMHFQLARARDMMLAGAPLVHRLPGRIGWELRLIVQGGLRIVERIAVVEHDVFRRRPQLATLDWGRLLWRAGCMRSGGAALRDSLPS